MRVNWNRCPLHFYYSYNYTSWFIVIILVLVLVYISGWGRDQIFTLTAISEIVRFKVFSAIGIDNPKDPASIRLHDVEVLINSVSTNSTEKPCNFDFLKIPKNTEIIAVRKGQGMLKLQIVSIDPANPPILVPKSNDGHIEEDIKLEKGTFITLSACSQNSNESFNDTSLIIPFEGKISVGVKVKNDTWGYLLSGAIQVVEKFPFPFFGLDDRIIVQETSLTRGDMIEWPCSQTAEDCTRKMPVFLYVGIDNAISVTAYMANPPSKKAHVTRPASGGYNVKVSIWKRLLVDPIFNALLIIIGIFEGRAVFSKIARAIGIRSGRLRF